MAKGSEQRDRKDDVQLHKTWHTCIPDTLQEIEDFRRNVRVSSLESKNTCDPRATNTLYTCIMKSLHPTNHTHCHPFLPKVHAVPLGRGLGRHREALDRAGSQVALVG